MKQIFNPYLPFYEYIPDGEPHVFGDRVYVYGSHDRFNGQKFCMNHYVCYSASVNNLKDWRYEGVIFRNDQDPRMQNGDYQLWAPDVVQGKDGRFYLYYCPDDRIREIGVAVCDTPAGKYEFLGIVSDSQGRPIGSRPGDTIQFDPGVFIDDDGLIYLYSGNAPRTRDAIGKLPKASVVMLLEDDMVTIKTEPKPLLPILGQADGTEFAGHEFFEASSIRKISGKYYFVYSSVTLHELCYAISDRPDRGFHYGGVIVSNCDMFPGTGKNKPVNAIGNNHGGIEYIGGDWYIFYHRHTNQTMYSRQGCAEKIEITADGQIRQVEITSCGLNGGPLAGEGVYSAVIACNLYGKNDPGILDFRNIDHSQPYFTQSGEDYDPESAGTPPVPYIANLQDGAVAVYKYFDLTETSHLTIVLRGGAEGVITVSTAKEILAEIPVIAAADWTQYSTALAEVSGVQLLSFQYSGKGSVDFLQFNLQK